MKKKPVKTLKKVLVKESNIIWDSMMRMIEALTEWDEKEKRV